VADEWTTVENAEERKAGGVVKIELVGGPECGNVVSVKFLEPLVQVKGVTYARRDRPFTLSDKHGALYGEKGARMYDHVKSSVSAE
jgi:hypothetical protein